ncbi:hypothetical protein TNCV_4898971 [Trichonephila clavipes]|nr:hypothetical protein TNCV_4898971 [Trichonephila clavipes]
MHEPVLNLTYAMMYYCSYGKERDDEEEWNVEEYNSKTATAGSDVVQSGRPIFDDFFNICGRISAITRRMMSSKWSSVCGLSA